MNAKSLLLAALLAASASAAACDGDGNGDGSVDSSSSDSASDAPAVDVGTDLAVLPDDAAHEPDVPPPPEPDFPGDFTVVLLPDTQKYTLNYPAIYEAQTRWIVDNLEAEGIVYVFHEGDITDDNHAYQWVVAKDAMEILDGEVLYTLAVGNHDMGFDGEAESRNTSSFNHYFKLSDYAWWPSFGGIFEGSKLDNSYHLFGAGGVRWLVLSIEFGPRDAVLEWANEVIEQHPERDVIIVTHAYLYEDDTLHGSSGGHTYVPTSYGLNQHPGDVNDGPGIWNKLVRLQPRIRFVFNGHVLGDGVGRLTSLGDHGNQVHQLLANYQKRANGGDGWLRLMRFSPGKRRVTVQTYSPTREEYMLDADNDFDIHGLESFAPVDDVAPELQTATAMAWPGGLTVVARFDETLDPDSAEEPANYSVQGSASVTAATLAADGISVELTLPGLVVGEQYTLSVDGVRDASDARNPMIGPQTLSFEAGGGLLSDSFEDGDLSGWTVVDEGDTSGPSEWTTLDGWLVQLSNIYDGNMDAVEQRLGTYLYWSAPEALAWTDYELEVTLRSEDDDGIGVLFRYQDADNYYKLELDATRAFRKLFRMENGIESLVAVEPVGFVPNEQMTLRVAVQGSQIEAFLNGGSLFGGAVDDYGPLTGTVAMYCWGNEGSWFDDVRVTPAAVP